MQKLVMNGTPMSPKDFKEHVTTLTKDQYPVLSGFDSESSGCGSYGFYIKLSKELGVKIIKAACQTDGGLCLARKEFENLMVCWKRKPSLFPRPYGVVELQWEGKKKYGIVMQHIDGMTASQVSYDKFRKIREKIEKQLDQIGIEHRDLHEGNVMVMEYGFCRRYKVIDCDPQFVKVQEREG